MADRYIDIFEVTEYGDFFLKEVARLVGVSPLLNVEALQKVVGASKEKVETERTKAGVSRKASDAEEVNKSAGVLRGHLSRFYSFLHSLDPAEVQIDATKFFPGDVLAGLQQLKPADVKARAEKVAQAFALDAYKDLAVLSVWKKKIEDGQQALSEAISGQGGGRTASMLLTASLSAARDEFLGVYNGVAKHLVRGLLNSLGRGEEFPLYFRDLQVNEDKRSAAPKATGDKPVVSENPDVTG